MSFTSLLIYVGNTVVSGVSSRTGEGEEAELETGKKSVIGTYYHEKDDGTRPQKEKVGNEKQQEWMKKRMMKALTEAADKRWQVECMNQDNLCGNSKH